MDVLMPQLGETVLEGKITVWFKSVGDKVAPGDNLFEIETDKVSMEVPATMSGIVTEIRVAAGDTVPVGAVVGIIDAAGVGAGSRPVRAPTGVSTPTARIEATKGAASAPSGAAAVAAPPSPSPARTLDPFFEVRTPVRNFGPARLASGIVITPLARRLAAQQGIDPARIKGSGPGGRIVKDDIAGAVAAKGEGEAAIRVGSSANEVKALFRDVAFEEIPIDAMRRTIARRLVIAKQTVPHFYLSVDVEVDRLLKLREEANRTLKDTGGTENTTLSLNDFFIKAWAVALQRVPAANSVWAEDCLLRFRHSDVAVAVAIEGGLITPVIYAAEQKTLTALSAEMKQLAVRARDRRLRPEEYQGGATTISNLGMYGVREFSAIINPPHATVLAVGAAQRCAIETPEGAVTFVSRIAVTVSCDHRAVDGALGAKLLAAFRGLIEHPLGLLI
jgi:pyruvate dehydrogenase E2 component (dihydrolipoamide acetyltransferase)